MGPERSKEIGQAARVIDRTARAVLDHYMRLLAAGSSLQGQQLTAQEAHESMIRHIELLSLSSSLPPVNYNHLLTRLREVEDPIIVDEDPIIEAHPLKLNILTRKVETPYPLTGETRTVSLSPKESRLLHVLMANKRRVVPYDMIINWVWQEGGGTQTGLRTHLSHIVKKTGARDHIRTEPGVGHSFVPSEEKKP